MLAAGLHEEVAKIRWFHSMDLGDGVTTPGVDRTASKLARLRLPQDLTGKSVLDIGAWDGFFSFEAERRGASRVLAIDRWADSGWASREGFDLAHSILGSKVEALKIDLYDLTPARVGVFDYVLFLGVLYHLREPLPGLERLRALTRERLIVETHVDMLHCKEAAAAFYPGVELNGDPSSWWGPNPAAVAEWLKQAGFARIEQIYLQPPVWRFGHAAHLALMRGEKFLAAFRRGRAVFHAFPE
jgi:tRNA (mo5U34)-methyltransferase